VARPPPPLPRNDWPQTRDQRLETSTERESERARDQRRETKRPPAQRPTTGRERPRDRDPGARGLVLGVGCMALPPVYCTAQRRGGITVRYTVLYLLSNRQADNRRDDFK
jgi:hypothetical protein